MTAVYDLQFPVYYVTGESEIPSLHMLITPNVKGIIREGEERIVRVVTLGCFDCMIRQLVPVYIMHICLRHSPVAYVSEHIEFFFPRGELVFFPICTDATSYRQAYLAFYFFLFFFWWLGNTVMNAACMISAAFLPDPVSISGTPQSARSERRVSDASPVCHYVRSFTSKFAKRLLYRLAALTSALILHTSICAMRTYGNILVI